MGNRRSNKSRLQVSGFSTTYIHDPGVNAARLLVGVATLFRTIGFGPVDARLSVVQGTIIAFIPIMIPLAAGKSVDAMAVLGGGVIVMLGMVVAAGVSILSDVN